MGYAENRTQWSVTTAPATEPVSTADAKTYLNVSTSLHDTLIANLVSASRILYEQFTGTAVITQTITQVWEWTPCDAEFELSVSPASGTPNVYYRDTNGDYQTWDSSNYTVETVGILYRIVKKSTVSWPTIGDFPAVWKITYSAGYASAAAVPEDVISAILLMTGFLYENREDIPISDSNNPKVRSFAAVAFGRKNHLI